MSTKHDDRQNDSVTTGSTHSLLATAGELTAFQTNILCILADDARYGLAVKRELERYYDEDVNHGRLYPNLDELVERGFVEKSELDKRTNEYAITERGRDIIEMRLDWIEARVYDDFEDDAE